MAYYGDSKIQAEDHHIFDEPVRKTGDDSLFDDSDVTYHMTAPSRLPEQPFNGNTYAQDSFGARTGAGFTHLKQTIFRRRGLNVMYGYTWGLPLRTT